MVGEVPRPPAPAPWRPRWWVVPAVLILAMGVALAVGLLREVTAAPAADGHHDFLAFHAAARMVDNGTPGRLYDASALTALEREVIPVPVGAAGYMPYINPPFGAVLQAPLGLLSEPNARVLWLLINIPLALLAGWLATGGLARAQRVAAALCVVVTFPFYQALIEGQWSFVMLLGCLVAVRGLRAHRPVRAGVGLATLALKPPLLVPVLVVLLVSRAWRAAVATVATVASVWLITLPWTGWATQVQYAGFLLGVIGSHLGGAGAAGASVWHGGMAGMEGINGLAAGYFGQERVAVVDGITATVLVAVLVRWAASARRVGLRFTGRSGRWLAVGGVAAALLADLHLYPQDCVLVLVALPELLALAPPHRRLAVALATAAVLDLVWLDQLAVTPHLLTIILTAAVVVSTGMAMRADRGRAPRVREPGRPAAQPV